VLAAGFTGYITKPIDFDVLLDSLARHLKAVRVAKAEATAAVTPASGDVAKPASTVVVGAPIASRLPTADPRFRSIVEEFTDQLDERVAAVEHAWSTRDFEALRIGAHYLKGAGGSVGFDVFTEPSAHLEQLAKAQQQEGVEDAIAVLRDLASRVVIELPADGPASVSTTPAKVEAQLDTSPIFSTLKTADPRFRAIVEEFIGQLDDYIGSLERSWKARDFESLRSGAHYLKGAGGSVGFDAFTEPSAHLEQLAKAQQEAGVEEAIAVLRDLASRVTVDAPTVEPAPQAAPLTQSVAEPRDTPIFSALPTSDPRFRAIVEEFIDQLDDQMAMIQRAWDKRDFEALRNAAHYLKGAGGSVGFDELTEPSAQLEQLAKAGQPAGVEDAIAELRALTLRVAIDDAESPFQAVAH